MTRLSKLVWTFAGVTAILAPVGASAATTTVRGRIVMTQGHELPACRTVLLRKNSDLSLVYFRIPETDKEDGILAVTMTALTSGLDAEIAYDPALTTGCGTEPKIMHISLLAAGV